ncbi:hypothetical protein M0811_05878 [Anaeramoeba ignava]|uniref:Uncharacterized protein n=1 Tax=Anaeramoeba ignava TaxID=1746090 RepID=A0A9Q0LRG5_ANAIG|nr:hypothetical protein M0811_05878 [Anaeramoeba ignava]
MNDCLFFGSNQKPNELIKNDEDRITKPIQFKFKFKFENENEKQIKQISSSNFSTIFLFKNGKAIEYLLEYFRVSKKNPVEIPIENIQKVVAGGLNEAILTAEGNLFGKGKDMNPKNPKEFINISSLIEDPNDKIIEDIAPGWDSFYLLTSNQMFMELVQINIVNLA